MCYLSRVQIRFQRHSKMEKVIDSYYRLQKFKLFLLKLNHISLVFPNNSL